MKKLLYELLINNTIQILQNDIDWYSFLAIAIAEKVEGYLFKFLSDNDWLERIPKQIRKVLYISYKYNKHKNTMYIKEFQDVQQIMLKNGIRVFPYRGLFLINDVYEDYGVRYMEDIDILTFKSNYNLIESVLKDSNYQLSLINDSSIDIYKAGEPIYSCLFIKTDPSFYWIPFVKLDISFSPMIFDNHEVYTNETNLSPEYVFLLLCKSLFDDSFEKTKVPVPENCTLSKIIDIIFFMKKYPTLSEYIMKYSPFSNMNSVKFTQRCIEYFSKGD